MAAVKRKKTQEKLNKRSPMEKITIFLILLFLAALTVASYSVIRKTVSRISSDFYFPFLKGIRSAERSMADSLLIMENKKTLAQAVLKLRQEKFTLLAKQSVYDSMAKENARLRQFLRMPARPGFTAVFAQLLYRDDTQSATIFLLDKGEKDGIRPGNIVVTPVQLKNSARTIIAVAGRVLETSRHTSTVASIYDKEFKLSIAFGDVTGVMQHLPEVEYPMCGLTFIPVHAKIRKNEPVFTSSLTGNAPAGLPVGRIGAITPRQTGISRDHVYQETAVVPFAAPSTLRFAAVYVKRDPSSVKTYKRK